MSYHSNEAVDWALELRASRRIGPTEGDLLLLMSLHVADEPMTPKGAREAWPPHHCWMSVESLAANSGRDLRTVRLCLYRLAAANVIEAVGRLRSGAAVYRLAVSHDSLAAEAVDRDQTVSQSSPDKSALAHIKVMKEVDEGIPAPTRKLAGSHAFASRAEKTRAMTCSQWLETIKAAGEQAIPPSDPIFSYGDRVGVDPEMLVIAWMKFKSRHSSGRGSLIRCHDWPLRFREHVEDNTYRLWFLDGAGDRAAATAVAKWTTAGLQALVAFKHELAERDAIEATHAVEAAMPPAQSQLESEGRICADRVRPSEPPPGIPDHIKQRLAQLRVRRLRPPTGNTTP